MIKSMVHYHSSSNCLSGKLDKHIYFNICLEVFLSNIKNILLWAIFTICMFLLLLQSAIGKSVMIYNESNKEVPTSFIRNHISV